MCPRQSLGMVDGKLAWGTTGESPMNRRRAIVGAAGVATPLVLVNLAATRGDEPNKPPATAPESNPASPAARPPVHGETFDDGPRQAAYLMPGMGKVSFPVTTEKPEAQAFINQGVGQLHSFYYFEAERSFRQVARIDPDCAMAYL